MSISYRTPRLGLLAAAMLLSGIPFAAGAPPARAATVHAVEISDMAFAPVMLHVAVGDTVTWTNADDRPHTVTAHGGGFDSGNLDEGQRYSFTFTEAGTFTYFCGYHDEMQATIVVEAATQDTATQAPSSEEDGGPAGTAAPEGSRRQPDTALMPAGGGARIPALLMGIGLIVMGISVVRAPRRRAVSNRPGGGWQR